MEKVTGPLPPPDVKWHRHDKEYIASLLQRANLSQRGAARLLGLNERTMRYYCSGEQQPPYPVQYALEVLAASHHGGVREPEVASHFVPSHHDSCSWHEVAHRPIQKTDVGQIIVAFDKHGAMLAGELAADEFGVTIRSTSGTDSHTTPAQAVERYTLLNKPSETANHRSTTPC